MKKNRMMRLASSLMVAVLLTTSVISGTFAKYVTEDSASDFARVAKFGVVLQADGDLYGDAYGKGAIAVSKPTDATADVSVIQDGSNLIAPGTQNDTGLGFSINGQPEVSTKLDVTIEAENIYLTMGTYAVMVRAFNVTEENFETNKYYTKNVDNEYVLAESFAVADYYTMEDKVILSNNYFPVVYKADVINDNINVDTLNAIAADYAVKLNGGDALAVGKITTNAGKTTYVIEGKEYAPNYNYALREVADEKLTWAWNFENGTDDVSKAMYNGADTILGHLMAGSLSNAEVVKIDGKIKAPIAADGVDANDYNLETSFSINMSVTQVD